MGKVQNQGQKASTKFSCQEWRFGTPDQQRFDGGFAGNFDIEDMVVDWLLDRLLHKLRNARGPEGDEAKKRIVTKVLNHDKLKEIGESQLKLSFVSKRYNKSAQFFNAVVRSRASLHHKLLHKFFQIL